jgi:K+-transporting ATPase c subunit
MTIATTVLLGILYPLLVTGLAQRLISQAGKRRADPRERM